MKEIFLDNNLPEQVRLERGKGISLILESNPQIKGNERMLLRKMVKAFRAPNFSLAHEFWSRIRPQTKNQAKALDLSEDEFVDLYKKINVYLLGNGSDQNLNSLVLNYREKTSPRGPGYRWNDTHQCSQKEVRSFTQLFDFGVKITVPEESLEEIKCFSEKSHDKPMLEMMKNERMVSINGFKNSLTTLVLHDPFDHFFATSIIRNTGLEGKYKNFFSSVGNPAETDLFSREGELVAAISYAYRVWDMVESGIQPTFTLEHVNRIIRKNNNQTENQSRVSEFIGNILRESPEDVRKYGYIVTSVVFQQMEQRRKQGFIRKLDDNFNIVDDLSLFDPEYLALIIDTAVLLSESEPLTHLAAINTTFLNEEYFRYISTLNIKGKQNTTPPHNLLNRIEFTNESSVPTLVLKITDMQDGSIVKNSSLPEDVSNWILNNPSFTATQYYLRK